MTVNWDNQRSKKPPQEPNNLSQPYRINAVIGGRKRINLVISYHYKKRNVEYLKGCRKEELNRTKIGYSTIKQSATWFNNWIRKN